MREEKADSHKGSPKAIAKGTWWDGGDVAETLTTTSHNQYMPDKNHFEAVVVRIRKPLKV